MLSVKIDNCCYFVLVLFFVAISAALNISKAIGFQEGIFEAIMLKTFTLEVTGDIRGAFQLAVFLKTLDLKVNYSHDVYAKSTILTRQDITQPKEVTVACFLIRIFFIQMASFLVKSSCSCFTAS